MADFLFEIGLEEVPARMIAAAQAEMLQRILALLAREHLAGAEPVAKSYSTPRRLAVLVEGVSEQQADMTEDITGPAVKIAFKDGAPTPAAEAFARKSGVPVSELRTISTPKGDYLAATIVKKGRSAAEVLASELPKEIAAIYWAKSMYWLSPNGQRTSGGDPIRAGKPERFVRPVVWMVCLLGEEVVPVAFAGKIAGRATFGHRVLSTGEAFEIVSPQSYLAQLDGEYVLADVEARRHKIRKALDHVTRTVAGLRWREDHALVDAVTHLTEWPDVLLGSFEPAYLELPEEVLVTVMRDHQKYFALEDADGKLAPHFLTVTNVALDEVNTPIIRQGNERVLKARFNDARFFWDFDQKIPLQDRVKLLENVTFQKDLGSYAAKSERVREVAAKLVVVATSNGVMMEPGVTDRAIILAKTDLTTELVKEFPELQGIIGGLYALKQNESTGVANAIYDQYLPISPKDPIPRTAEGCLVSVTDRIVTISGMFSIGAEPTGSKDPFALRRAANSVVRILSESQLRVTLGDVIRMSTDSSGQGMAIQTFFRERVEFYLRDVRGNAYDTVAAVLNAHLSNPNSIFGNNGYDDLVDTVERAEAVTRIRGSRDFLAVCRAYKRVRNLYLQALADGDTMSSFLPVFASEIEVDLWKEMEFAGEGYLADCLNRQYDQALAKLVKLGPSIDRYFNEVMIRVDDLDVRALRLGLVRYLMTTFVQIADFSEIVIAG